MEFMRTGSIKNVKSQMSIHISRKNFGTVFETWSQELRV